MDPKTDNTLTRSLRLSDTLPVDASAAFSAISGLSSGVRIGERYALVRKIGAGAMGEVWEARHTLIEKPIAIKFFAGNQADADGLQRFWREARATAALRHPGIIDILDFGTTDAGVPYIVMELLYGRPLSSALAEDGPLPWPRVQALLLELTSALGHAHRRGIIHRDLKPSNIFLAREADDPEDGGGERCKIIDFGIAKLIRHDPAGAASLKTATGMVLGTLAYMSPEQLGDKPIDARTDIYSLGCVAYELLTGHRPFESNTPTGLVLQHLFERPVPPGRRFPAAAIPEDVEAVILRALCKDADNRFASMEEMRAAVQRLGSGAPPVHVPVEHNTAARAATDSIVHALPPARRRWLPLALVVSSAALGAAAWWVVRANGHVPEDSSAATLPVEEDDAAPPPLRLPNLPREPPIAGPQPDPALAPALAPPPRQSRRRPADATAPAGSPPPAAPSAGEPAPVQQPAPPPAGVDDAWERQRRLKSPFAEDDP